MARWRRHDSLPTDCLGRRSSLIFEPTRVKKDPRSFFKGQALAFYKPMGAVRMCRCLRRWSCCMWRAWRIIPSEFLSGARSISAAPGRRKWPVLLLIKMGSLDRFEIGQYPLARTPTLGLPSFQSRALPKAVEHLALHSEVGLQIASRCRHRGVTQIVTNGRQINAGLEQRDGATVAQHVRVNRRTRQAGVFLTSEAVIVTQEVSDPIAGERLTVRVQEDLTFRWSRSL